jgi:F0F1-type ATP synthase epsilon subunit
MQVRLLSPTSFQVVDARWIEVNTDVGNFVIERGHMPMVLALANNKPLILGLPDDSRKVINITTGGIVEVSRSLISVFLDQSS